ncbi:MAG: hypothetical protein GY950_19700, partial [bacterium]|nr:hypothetical protein [bacterium]
MKDAHLKSIRFFKERRTIGAGRLRRGKPPDPPKPFESYAWLKPVGVFVAGLLAGVFYYSLTLNVPADEFDRVVVKAKDWGIYTLVAWLIWPFFRLVYRVIFKRWDLIDALSKASAG